MMLDYNKIINKVVNSLIKKYNIPYNYRDDLKQEGYLIVRNALKSYDKTKGKSLEFWVNLKVNSGLSKYIQTKILKNEYNKVSFDNNLFVVNNEQFEIVKELFNNLSFLEKFLLKKIVVDGVTYKYIQQKYNIPIKIARNIIDNLLFYFKEGKF